MRAKQLGEGKRLDEVIVGAKREAPDAILDRFTSSKHQDRRATALSPYLGKDRPPVSSGQHDVEDYQIVLIVKGVLETVFTIVASIDDETLLGQALLQVPSRLVVILYDQQFHRRGTTLAVLTAEAFRQPTLRNPNSDFNQHFG